MYLFGKGLDRSNKLEIDFLDYTHLEDPGFPVGGRGLGRGGHRPPRWLRFENFACQNERIWICRGVHVLGAPPKSANGFATSNIEIGDDQ